MFHNQTLKSSHQNMYIFDTLFWLDVIWVRLVHKSYMTISLDLTFLLSWVTTLWTSQISPFFWFEWQLIKPPKSHLSFDLSDNSLNLPDLTFLLSWVTTLWTSHNCSSFSWSEIPDLNSSWRLFSKDSCFSNSSSNWAGLSGNSNDHLECAGLMGGLYLK